MTKEGDALFCVIRVLAFVATPDPVPGKITCPRAMGRGRSGHRAGAVSTSGHFVHLGGIMGGYSSWLRIALGFFGTLLASGLQAQTTAGIGTTIVFPVTAQTTSFASEVTLFNPGPSALTASVAFYEANNSGHPGLKPCTDISIAAARSAQLALSTQCTLT